MSKKTFKYPISKFILVKPVPVQAVEELDGLVMPTSSDEGNLKKVEVVQINEEAMPSSIKVGTILVVPAVTRNEIKIDGLKHYLVHLEEVLAYESEEKQNS